MSPPPFSFTTPLVCKLLLCMLLFCSKTHCLLQWFHYNVNQESMTKSILGYISLSLVFDLHNLTPRAFPTEKISPHMAELTSPNSRAEQQLSYMQWGSLHKRECAHAHMHTHTHTHTHLYICMHLQHGNRKEIFFPPLFCSCFFGEHC